MFSSWAPGDWQLHDWHALEDLLARSHPSRDLLFLRQHLQ